MRTTIMLLMVAAVSVVSVSANAEGARKGTTCVYKSDDLGTIVGRGPSSSAAFEDAATKCFDRRAHLYKAKHNQTVDEDAGLTIIDVCANITCA